MKRRRFLGGCLVPVLATAGCTEQSGSNPAAATTARTTGDSTPEGQTTAVAIEDSQAVPGWDGSTLDTATLVDAHVRELSSTGSYTASIEGTNTQNGDVRLQFQLNASQQRVFGTMRASQRDNRAFFLTPERAVTRVAGDDPTYTTSEEVPFERQFEAIATYDNDDFGIAFGESVQAFEYATQGQTTHRGEPVVRFTSTSSDLGADAEAVLLVGPQGVIRSAEFHVRDATLVHEFSAVGSTTVSQPAWLDDALSSTSDDSTTEAEDTSVQDGDLVVDVEAAQWFWQFTYDDSGVNSIGDLVVPVDQPVALRATTQDVHHALTIPAFETTVHARPDETNVARFTPTETGEVSLECTEYCGEGHSEHTGSVVVMNEPEYEAWIAEQ